MAILGALQSLFAEFSTAFPFAATLSAALLFGLIPALIWLVFWLSEDRAHPEPKRLIARAFIGGGIALLITLPIEAMIAGGSVAEFSPRNVFLFSVTEESIKYIVAFVIVLRSRELDEGVDALIYMISIALGFAALENVLYILGPLADAQFLEAATTSNLRFLGATLLHVVASAAIGVSMALAYYSSKAVRIFAVGLGLATAIGLHTLFNFLIINLPDEALYTVFLTIWLLVVGLLIITERVKKADRIHEI